jgi:hypothetical protein
LRHHCKFFILSEPASDEDLMRGIFVAFLTEVLVDLGSGYVERAQGIRPETWWRKLSVNRVATLSVIVAAMLAANLWSIIDLSGTGTCAAAVTAGLGLNITNATNTTNTTNASVSGF